MDALGAFVWRYSEEWFIFRAMWPLMPQDATAPPRSFARGDEAAAAVLGAEPHRAAASPAVGRSPAAEQAQRAQRSEAEHDERAGIGLGDHRHFRRGRG